jgi:hypothetical protein
MKKVIVSSVLLGLTVSVSSVFAEAPVPTLYAVPTVTSASVAVTSAPTPVVASTADVVVPTTPSVTSVSPVIEKSEVIKTNSLVRIKARGAQLIKERVNSLNENAQTIATSKTLTTEQKAVFAAFFSGKVADLNALNTKIQTGTEASSTKVLVTSIFTDFRIYGVLLPQLRIQKRIYDLQNHSAKLTETFAKIQTKIDEFKAKGKDVTVWQKSLDDAKTLVTTDTAKLQPLLVKINELKPSDYGTTSKTVIESVNKDVRSIAKDFQSINGKVKRPETLRAMKVVEKVHTASTTGVQ